MCSTSALQYLPRLISASETVKKSSECWNQAFEKDSFTLRKTAGLEVHVMKIANFVTDTPSTYKQYTWTRASIVVRYVCHLEIESFTPGQDLFPSRRRHFHDLYRCSRLSRHRHSVGFAGYRRQWLVGD